MTTCYSTCTSQTKIRKYLTQESCEIAVHVFITSKLDYCNSLLYGCRKMQLKKLQYVQNAAARIVTQTRKFYHITPVLFDLHWLPVSYRIVFKILLLVFKSLFLGNSSELNRFLIFFSMLVICKLFHFSPFLHCKAP